MPRSSSEGYYKRPLRSSAPNDDRSLIPACACGLWHYGTNANELWWACVGCGKRLDRVYSMIMDKQVSGSVRLGM